MVYVFYPSRKTLTISLTGGTCSLMCDHCNAVYLKSMLTKEADLKIIKDKSGKYESALISGGSTVEGKVPGLSLIIFKAASLVNILLR